MYFLLAWFHAVIQERLRYAPLGWSKKYEFGESDLRSACDTVDTWLDDTAKASTGRAVGGAREAAASAPAVTCLSSRRGDRTSRQTRFPGPRSRP